MLIFLDTEFTDSLDCDLISIGMVSEDGEHELYLERSDYRMEWCNSFVHAAVLPQLGSARSGHDRGGALNSSKFLNLSICAPLSPYALGKSVGCVAKFTATSFCRFVTCIISDARFFYRLADVILGGVAWFEDKQLTNTPIKF